MFGFDTFKEIKIAIGVIAALIIATAIGLYIYRGHEVVALKVDNGIQKAKIDSLGDTIDKSEKSAEITSDVRQAAEEKTAIVIKKQETIASKTEDKVEQIHQKYRTQEAASVAKAAVDKPPQASPEVTAQTTVGDLPSAEDIEVSQARIDGLWQSYCEATGGAGSNCSNGTTTPSAT